MVVIAVIGILVLLALPKINGYIEKAELARIQNDIRTMEYKIEEGLINNSEQFYEWDDTTKDLGLLVLNKKLYEIGGIAKNVDKSMTTIKKVMFLMSSVLKIAILNLAIMVQQSMTAVVAVDYQECVALPYPMEVVVVDADADEDEKALLKTLR